jgi:hypothetical protein
MSETTALDFDGGRCEVAHSVEVIMSGGDKNRLERGSGGVAATGGLLVRRRSSPVPSCA